MYAIDSGHRISEGIESWKHLACVFQIFSEKIFQENSQQQEAVKGKWGAEAEA